MKRFAWTLGFCVVLLLGLVAVLPTAAQADPAETESSEADEKARAREERIQEYLRKKEERRLRRESEEARKQEEAEARRTAETMAEGNAPTADEAVEPTGKKGKKSRAARQSSPRKSALPRNLARLHETLRATEFGQDATVAPYMDLIAAGDATAQQIAAFGNFLGQGGRNEAALAYYDLALSIDDEDPTIWLNAGTLQRQIGNLQAAAGAYSEALSLDPGHAYAHYNLGAVLDEMGDYDNAIEEYKLALVLDPDLGNPALNPQAANNEKLVAVRLLLYKEQAGSLGLPLVTVPDGEVRSGN